MKRSILAVVIFVTIVTSEVTLVQAEGFQRAFRTCESLRKSDPFFLGSGVASSAGVVGFTGAKVDQKLYMENRKLDIDNDGVACELAIYDLNVTKTTAGVSTAYSACKAYRTAEQNAASLYGQIDRYWNTTDYWLVQLSFMKQAADLMKQASNQNKTFLKGASSAKAMSDFYNKSYILSISGKENSSKLNSSDFTEWCALFGIYSSHTGMFPPIDIKVPNIPSTSLNGAKMVCQNLFAIAPRGQLLYSGNDSISLEECDRNARSVASTSSSYSNANQKMKRIYFSNFDFWCWGRNNCVTEDDM
jgi:Excalibur calcium-binding domain